MQKGQPVVALLRCGYYKAFIIIMLAIIFAKVVENMGIVNIQI